MKTKQLHPFHLVTNSPWPISISVQLFALTVYLVMWFHGIPGLFFFNAFFFIGPIIFFIVLTMSLWFRDIIRESTFQGNHTKKVQKGLKLGFMLFLVSEAMLFISFFWAFFHSSLVPTIEIGAVWPPYNLNIIEPFSIPLLNTLILLLSGFYLTWSHKVLVNRAAKQATITTLVITIFLAFFFIFFQGYEYCTSSLTFNDGIYGSVFYIATGFHGLHVIVGTIFLIVNLYRLKLNHFTPTHHLGFEFGAWYWHFVDVIWIFLFLIIYCWGGLSTESVRFIY